MAWVDDEQIDGKPPDTFKMKQFEIDMLGRFDESSYGSNSDNVTKDVKDFREQEIVQAYASQIRKHGSSESFDVTDLPAVRNLLGETSWERVTQFYDDLDPAEWTDPPSNTKTAEVKEKAIENMQDMFGYSEKSAELASRHIMELVAQQSKIEVE